MDELEDALEKKDITQEQFKLAMETSEKLRKGILSDITDFIKYTKECLEVVK